MGLSDELTGALGLNSGVQVGAQTPLQTQSWMPGWTGSLLDSFSGNLNNQKDLANQYGQVATGQNSPLQTLANNQASQNAAQAAGVYANNRAINPALAARAGANMQANANQGLANTLAMQRLGALGAQGQMYGQIGQQNQGMFNATQGAIAAQNQAANQANQVNAGVAAGNQQSANNLFGGVMSGLGTGMSMGGGGGGGAKAAGGGGGGAMAGGMDASQLGSMATLAAAKGGEVPRMAGGGMCHRNPLIVLHEKLHAGRMNMKTGGSVPGRAQVKGNSYKNDTVPAVLSPGEIVLPRTVSQAGDAPARAAKFVRSIQSKKGSLKRSPK